MLPMLHMLTSSKAKSIPVAISARDENTPSAIIASNGWILMHSYARTDVAMLQEPLQVGGNERSFEETHLQTFNMP